MFPLPIFCIADALCTIGCTASWSCLSCVGFVYFLMYKEHKTNTGHIKPRGGTPNVLYKEHKTNFISKVMYE
jgi:hypothetical protein